jgi:hypothetical protein
MVLEVCGYHGKETVRPNAAVEVRIEVSNRKDVLKKDDDSLDLRHLGCPVLHEKSRLVSHACNSTNVDSYVHFNRPSSWTFVCIQIVKSHRIVNAKEILSSFRLKEWNRWIDLQFDDGNFGIQISGT